MTTLRKLISEIDFKNKNLQTEPNWTEISMGLGIDNLFHSEDTRLTAHFIKVHYCTDTWVGVRAYFLDGEFVAVSKQLGRKSCEEFGFVSKEIAIKVRDYLFKLTEPNELEFELIDDLDEDVPKTFKIQYNTQILHKTALLDGQRVEIIKTNFDNEGIKSPNYFHSVLIKSDDVEFIVDCKDLDFEYNKL